MAHYPRYAIYYVPGRDSVLYGFGSSWLGYDAYQGRRLECPPEFAAAGVDWPELTRAPRVYGFHATLKAPFALAPGQSEANLMETFQHFAALPRPIPAIELQVEAIRAFLALVPARREAALQALAFSCVEAFEPFRAPLSAEDRARRMPGQLGAAELANLDVWGYPYVGDSFRFHMTLTGSVPAERRARLGDFLDGAFRARNCAQTEIGQIAVSRQDAAGAGFRIVASAGLRAK